MLLCFKVKTTMMLKETSRLTKETAIEERSPATKVKIISSPYCKVDRWSHVISGRVSVPCSFRWVFLTETLLDRDPPPRTVKSGGYASYWNAFLFPTISVKYDPLSLAGGIWVYRRNLQDTWRRYY